MGEALYWVGIGLSIAGLIALVIAAMNAFEEDVVKGLCVIIIPPYAFYYVIRDYDEDNKWTIFAFLVLGLVAPMIATYGSLLSQEAVPK